MKILLIGNLPQDGQQSMQRFTDLLHHGLSARNHDVTVLTPTLRLARLGPRYHYNGLPKYLGYFDKFVLFPRQLRRHMQATRPDIVHLTDQASAVYMGAIDSQHTIATCHDLLQIRAAAGEISQHTLSRAARAHQNWIRRNLNRVPHVACVSEQTRSEVLRLTAMGPSKTSVVSNALNYSYRPIAAAIARERLDALSATAHKSDPFKHGFGGFVLHVGGEHWYKNRPGLLAIYAALRTQISPPPTLVIVGPALDAEASAIVEKLGLETHITVFTNVSNLQLEALYSLAEALIFPSLEEGFGWPIVEAQACGCPVFTSNRAPMPEVGGRFAYYFDPTNPLEAAQIISAAWVGRHVHRDAAISASGRWHADVMLDAYEALYRRLRA
ncbi:glycosyltransferase family 4 protein [Oleiharenicola lentus]|uniref:glycosyltransferase family 4 protein n=1 Tax=Oleiharenicola lentus TaxID=2508720 RepID=UPI003F678C7D